MLHKLCQTGPGQACAVSLVGHFLVNCLCFCFWWMCFLLSLFGKKWDPPLRSLQILSPYETLSQLLKHCAIWAVVVLDMSLGCRRLHWTKSFKTVVPQPLSSCYHWPHLSLLSHISISAQSVISGLGLVSPREATAVEECWLSLRTKTHRLALSASRQIPVETQPGRDVNMDKTSSSVPPRMIVFYFVGHLKAFLFGKRHWIIAFMMDKEH